MTNTDFPATTGTYRLIGRNERGRFAMTRQLVEELPVAFVYNGSTEAVMMATPADLEDFAVGFSRTEEIITRPSDIGDLTIVPTDPGIELRMWLVPEREATYRRRRRRLAGPTGCGLCGVESLANVLPPMTPVAEGDALTESDIGEAVAALAALQDLHQRTRAAHAAAFFTPQDGIKLIREDVGRHNALDKLAGAMSRERCEPAGGAVVLTSRVSVELVQKTATIGAQVIIEVSAPTALAVRTAEAANITLVGVARGEGYQVFTHPRRILSRSRNV
jgi:FdhD protein